MRRIFSDKNILAIFIFFISSFLSAQVSLVNTAHLDFLYEEINVDNNEMGIIHIYSNYPEYNWTGDDDEGIACVDDAARAAIFYMNYSEFKNDSASLSKAKKLLNFVMYMQSENGFFYNFIWEDYSINKTFRTSIAEPNWWTWRAIWALAEGQKYFGQSDPDFTNEIILSLKKAVNVTCNWLTHEKAFVNNGGIDIPQWLPFESAADQAAILILGFSTYFSTNKDSSVLDEIDLLCDGLLVMQQGDENSEPYFAFLSWQNTWHAWGNSQANALLFAGRILNKPKYSKAGLNEVKYFYPYLKRTEYLAEFKLKKDGDFQIKDKVKFPQIAYGYRPMIMACLEAFEMTKDTSIANLCGELAGWFFGDNSAGEQMYFPLNGRCYDGILNENEINKNSGAESTIEALLSILTAEQNLYIRNKLFKYNADIEKLRQEKN